MSNDAGDFFSGDDAASDDDAYSDTPCSDGVDYRPISAADDSDSDVSTEDAPYIYANGGGSARHCRNPDSGSTCNGLSALDLNGSGDADGAAEGDTEDEEERRREASIWRAFREDERRRAAPLPPQNAARVMEAMRGVSFTGFAPAWAATVPEDRWIGQLRNLRRSEPAPQN